MMALDMLSSLLVKLLTLVAAYLEWKDCVARQLTCRRVKAVVFPIFTCDSFTTCHVMHGPESIKTLIKIYKS